MSVPITERRVDQCVFQTVSSNGQTVSPNGRRGPGALAPSGGCMSGFMRVALGLWLVAFGAVALGHVLWSWSLASRLLVAPAHAVRTQWLWWSFRPTTVSALLLVVVSTACAGSLATVGLVFANRAGHRTLEQHWQWWYVLRPLAASSIGVLFYAVVVSGLLGGTKVTPGELSVAAAVGGLARLFTDRVLALMRGALGASAFNVSASDAKEAAATGGAA